jgi:tRNA-Thr(GGU) m(6)t(6)A37 methyltransferase TsaA
MKQGPFHLIAIGTVHLREKDAWIEIFPPYLDGLLGLEQFSHIHVLYWLHENDHEQGRAVLHVHPCGNESNPPTGVFATHSPRRPNPIALTRCRIKTIEGNRIVVDEIDAFDGSPVIDIKSFFPDKARAETYRFPRWEKGEDRTQ